MHLRLVLWFARRGGVGGHGCVQVTCWEGEVRGDIGEHSQVS